MTSNADTNLYIGLMSGTSADGVDAALVDFTNPQPQLLHSLYCPYPGPLKARVESLYQPAHNEIDRLGSLDVELATLYADAVTELLDEAGKKKSQIQAIGCHGQTIRHRPRPGQGYAFSLQIGCPNTLAQRTGITTVADFRRRDMAAGGQGAPLAPAFHNAVFHSNKEHRAVVNIGGIANITLLPESGPVTGFDTGPGNGLMDAWIQLHQHQRYDQDGAWAQTGANCPPLLATLKGHPYFRMAAPKSTGREEFSLNWLMERLVQFPAIAPQDVQATLLEFTAVTIADALMASMADLNAAYICGGGCKNPILMARLDHHLPRVKVNTSAELGVDPDWVEAMAFAWLARQTLLGLAGNLPSVTGAREQTILGGIYPGTCWPQHS